MGVGFSMLYVSIHAFIFRHLEFDHFHSSELMETYTFLKASQNRNYTLLSSPLNCVQTGPIVHRLMQELENNLTNLPSLLDVFKPDEHALSYLVHFLMK